MWIKSQNQSIERGRCLSWAVPRMLGSHRSSEWQCKQLTDKHQGNNECCKCRSANNRTPEIDGGRICFLWVTLCSVDQVILASSVRALNSKSLKLCFKHPASFILQTMKGGRKRRFHFGLLSPSFVPQLGFQNVPCWFGHTLLFSLQVASAHCLTGKKSRVILVLVSLSLQL